MATFSWILGICLLIAAAAIPGPQLGLAFLGGFEIMVAILSDD